MSAVSPVDTGRLLAVQPRCFNVQFGHVTAAALDVTAVPGTSRVAAHIGDALYLSFNDRDAAREFFARGLELVDGLPEADQ